MDLTTFLRLHDDRLLVTVLSGSHAYGLATESSDVDRRGIFVTPPRSLLSIYPPLEHVQDPRGDCTLFSLRKFLLLASEANPAALELLFAPDGTILQQHETAHRLFAARSAFVSKRLVEGHIGYARAQVARARGHNKWINNPQPVDPPRREDFCHVILGPWPGSPPMDGPGPLRPRPLRETGIDLQKFHCAAQERVPRTYRLYEYGTGARGVFRGGQIVCESIPVEDEWTRLRGWLVFDEEGYERRARDHRSYWQWRKERNEARWQTQERGEVDYDAKNMMHTFRLLKSARSIVQRGQPQVRFDGEERLELLSIRAGVHGYDELAARAEAEIEEVEAMAARCSLPAVCDPELADSLLVEVTEAFDRRRS